MSASQGVLLVTPEPKTERAVLTALNGHERLQVGAVVRTLPDLAERLESRTSALALVDIDPNPSEALRTLEGVTARFRETRFVVLSGELRSDLVLEAMQAGARHFLVKDSVDANLVATLQRLLPSRDSSQGGSVVTLLSVSGGCGSTTLAVNLANELQIASSQPTLLVDLDEAYGALATYLDLKGQYGVSDVLASTGRIDGELVRSTAVAHSERLQVLVSPASTGRSVPTPLDYGQLEQALKAFKAAYRYTVLDAPRVPIPVAAALARASKLTCLVLQLTVKDLRTAKWLWNSLLDQGISRDRVLAVVNRYKKRGQMLSLDDFRKALPDLPLEMVWNDYRSAVMGLNYGQPLAQIAPRSALRRSVEAIATKVLQPAQVGTL